MTTTIDTNGRATGQTTAVRALDLKPGDVIEATWEELAEVRLVEPIVGTGQTLLVFVGGHTDHVTPDARYGVVDPERAEKWRAYQRELARRDRLATYLHHYAGQFANGELPLPGLLGVDITVHVDNEAAVEQAAKVLGVEVELRGERTRVAELPLPRSYDDDMLNIQFRALLPAEEVAADAS